MAAATITLAEPTAERITADEKWGYRFGVDGVVSQAEASKLLANASVSTLERRAADDLIRDGKDGERRVVYCRRSLMNYIASLEK